MYVIIKKGAGKAPDLQLVTRVSLANVQSASTADPEFAQADAYVESRSIMKVPEFVIEALDGLRFEYKEQAMSLLLMLSQMGEEILDYEVNEVE